MLGYSIVETRFIASKRWGMDVLGYSVVETGRAPSEENSDDERGCDAWAEIIKGIDVRENKGNSTATTADIVLPLSQRGVL